MMGLIVHPWHLLVVAIASIINREQTKVLEYVRAENTVLNAYSGRKRSPIPFQGDH